MPWLKQLMWIINMGYYYYIVICLSALLMGQCLQFYRGAELNRSSGEKKKKKPKHKSSWKKKIKTIWTLLVGGRDGGVWTQELPELISGQLIDADSVTTLYFLPAPWSRTFLQCKNLPETLTSGHQNLAWLFPGMGSSIPDTLPATERSQSGSCSQSEGRPGQYWGRTFTGKDWMGSPGLWALALSSTSSVTFLDITKSF